MRNGKAERTRILRRHADLAASILCRVDVVDLSGMCSRRCSELEENVERPQTGSGRKVQMNMQFVHIFERENVRRKLDGPR